ncbi:MAG TPA: hypothetical protein VMW21_02950 [Patescibacteria group bacterium]|nr:hypothetical protein [Patescibacteria group bacterium]
MSKKLITVIVIAFCLIIAGGWFYFSNYQVPIFTPGSPEEIVPEQEETPPIHILSDRADVSSVGGGGGIYPTFIKELIIDPAYKVEEDEEQYFSIWLKDPAGIVRATATIKTDKEDWTVKAVIELQLAEGTAEEGRWEGTWITDNIPTEDVTLYYLTDFWVINKDGGERKLTSSWYSKN